MATLGAALITGGPGSGKTEEVVARLAARYESNPLYEADCAGPNQPTWRPSSASASSPAAE